MTDIAEQEKLFKEAIIKSFDKYITINEMIKVFNGGWCEHDHFIQFRLANLNFIEPGHFNPDKLDEIASKIVNLFMSQYIEYVNKKSEMRNPIPEDLPEAER